jgi:drug/metabolite transporter (DMT)-like permease
MSFVVSSPFPYFCRARDNVTNLPWWVYVVMAGLAWGTYVPIIFYGGSELGGKPSARLMAILCVGIAYFVLAVVFPLILFLTGQEQWPEMKTTGLVFSGLAGVAGAVGAICVVFASKAAMGAGLEMKKLDPNFDPASYRVLIAPLIFGLAPLINTLLSTIWHPQPGNPFHFDFQPPGWKLWAGILLLAAGVFLVLYSKEEAEEAKKKQAGKPPVTAPIAAIPTPPPA